MVPVGLGPSGLHAPSWLDDVGADVQLGSWFTNFADEDMDLAEEDLVPILD
jgi:hypothetical protein